MTAFLAWQAYLHVRFPGPIAAPGTAYQLPFAGLLAEIRRALGGGHLAQRRLGSGVSGADGHGIGLALALLRRGLSASAVAATLFGISLLVLTFGSDWSYTRLSAPMFAALLLAGLERRCAAGAGRLRRRGGAGGGVAARAGIRPADRPAQVLLRARQRDARSSIRDING